MDEAIRAKLKIYVEEIGDSMTIVSSQKELQKNLLNEATKECNLTKKQIKRLAKIYCEEVLEKLTSEIDELEETHNIAESLFTPSGN